jgi:hypothetical protein
MPPLVGGISFPRSSVGSLAATDVFSPPIHYKMVVAVHSSSSVRLGGGPSAASCGFYNNVWGLLQWMEVDRRACSGNGGKDMLFWGCFCNSQTSQGSFCKVGMYWVCFNIIPFFRKKYASWKKKLVQRGKAITQKLQHVPWLLEQIFQTFSLQLLWKDRTISQSQSCFRLTR